MPRQARLDSPGTLHHVIIHGIEKKDIVADRYDRKNMLSRLGNLSEETKTKIYAWALMSNHMHILLKSGLHGLSKFMKRLLTGYAITYLEKVNPMQGKPTADIWLMVLSMAEDRILWVVV